MYFMRCFLKNSLFNHHLWSFHMTFYNPHFHHSLKSLLCDALSFLGHPRPFPSPSPTSPQLTSHHFSFPLLPWLPPPLWSACASPQMVNQVDRESGMLPTNFVNGAWNLLASATTRSRDVMRSTQMGQQNNCLCWRSSGRWIFPRLDYSPYMPAPLACAAGPWPHGSAPSSTILQSFWGNIFHETGMVWVTQGREFQHQRRTTTSILISF